MTFLTASDPATSFSGVGDGLSSAPPLRLVRSGAKPQNWTLPAGRCTVGSSPQCQVHLPDDEVRPLHCLIVHSAQETQITRWAPNALLNGEDFSTSPLKPGDQLTIGGVELELVAEGAPAAPTKQPTEQVAPSPLAAPVAQLSQPEGEPAGTTAKTPRVSSNHLERQPEVVSDDKSKAISAQRERDRKVRHLWSANYNARSRCRQIIGSLRALRTESDGMDQQIDALRGQLHRAVGERERLANELKQMQAEHDQRERQSAAELDRLISELTAAYERANVAEESIAGQVLATEQLREEIASLSKEREQLQQTQAEDAQNRILLSEELADRDRAIEQLHRQLGQAQESNQRAAEESELSAAQVKNLEQQLKDQRTRCEQLAAEHANSADRLLQLEQTLADRDSSIHFLESQLEEAVLAEKTHQQRQAQQTAMIDSLESERNRLHGERDDLIVDQSKRVNQLRELEQSLLNRDLTVSHLESQLQEAAAATQAAEQHATDCAAKIESLAAERDSLATDQAKQLGQLQEMGETISSRDCVIEQLQRRLVEAHEAARQAEQQSAEHVAKIQSLEFEREALGSDQAKLTGQVQELGETVAQRDRAIEQLQRQIEEAHLVARQAEQQSAEHVAKIQSLEFEREALGSDQAKLSGQLQELGETVAQRDQAIDRLQRQLDEARQAARLADEQATKYVATIEGLHAELEQKDAHREQLAELRAEFAERRRELEESLAERDQSLEKLQFQLDAATEAEKISKEREAAQAEAVKALELDFKEQQAEREKSIAKQAETAARLEELEHKLAERDRRCAQLEQEYTSICQILQNLEKSSFEQVDECRRLEEQLAEVRKKRDELAAVQSGHDGQLQELQTALETRDREVEELNDQLAVATARRSEAESEAAERVEASRLLAVEAEQLRARCEKLTGDMTMERVKQHELRQSIIEFEERIEALKAECEAYHEAQLEQKQDDEQRLAAQESLAKELAEMREQYGELNKSYESECEIRKAAHQEVATRNERIELLEVDLRSASSESKQAFEKLAQMAQERAAVEEQLSALRGELETSNSRLAELAECESQGMREREQMAGELEAARQELAQLQEQAQKSRDELDGLPEQLTAFEEEKAALVQQLESQQALAERLSSELEEVRGRCSADQAQRDQFESLYEQSQRELAATRECLLTAEKSLREALTNKAPSLSQTPDSATSATVEQVDDVAAEKAIEHLRELSVWSDNGSAQADEAKRSAEVPEASADDFQPSSFIDKYSHMLDGEGSADSASPIPWETPAAAPSPESPLSALDASNALLAAPSHEESDEAALEAYMSSLMSRVRGDAHSAPSHPASPPVAKDPQPSGSAKEPTPEQKAVIREVAEPLDRDSQRKTSCKPPMPTDMKAMRELANSSARRAIAKHSKRRHLERAFSKSFVCMVASGVAAFMMLSAESFQSPIFLAALVPAFVGLCWGFKLLGIFLEAIRESSWRKTSTYELSIDESPLPIDGRVEAEQKKL